jgi:sigma-B regulation protein RsbU (phosphoserine phosphatase)
MEHGQKVPDPTASSASSRGTDFKALHRKLEGALAKIERTENISKMVEVIIETLLAGFQEELGFEGGRLYRREEDDFYLCCGFGTARDAPVGLRVPPDYPPHRRTLDEGLLIMRAGDPGYDETFERTIGVSSTFAAIAVGKGNTHIIAFSIDGEVQEERVLYSLSAVRHVVNLKLEQQKVTDMLEESRAIQESMLPSAPPALEGYDIDGRSRAAELVSGDLFDYLPLSKQRLGIAIADASGHGVPAALLARDVITGLRMSVNEDVKFASIIERLNQVIHRAALSRMFVSLFYGEFAQDGTVVYCNAGHSPPLLLRSGSCLELEPGGPVLGPIPGARYHSGQERLQRGDQLVMYSDGLVEHEDRRGQSFGTNGLRRVLRDAAGASPGDVIDAIFAAVDARARGTPQRDDITIVVVRKT